MLISTNQDLSILQIWVISSSQQSYERGTIIGNTKEKKSKHIHLDRDGIWTQIMWLQNPCS